MLYSTKEVCSMLDMNYETLKFYCKEGLVPNVKRDKNNYRIFDERNVAWIKGLQCLRRCGMSIKDMHRYMDLCIVGKDSIPERKEMLAVTKEELLRRRQEIEDSIKYIDDKNKFYDDVLAGNVTYYSNLTDN